MANEPEARPVKQERRNIQKTVQGEYEPDFGRFARRLAASAGLVLNYRAGQGTGLRKVRMNITGPTAHIDQYAKEIDTYLISLDEPLQ